MKIVLIALVIWWLLSSGSGKPVGSLTGTDFSKPATDFQIPFGGVKDFGAPRPPAVDYCVGRGTPGCIEAPPSILSQRLAAAHLAVRVSVPGYGPGCDPTSGAGYGCQGQAVAWPGLVGADPRF